MELFTNFQYLLAAYFQFSTVQAIDPLEGDFLRMRCLDGRYITGCNETLIQAFNRTQLAQPNPNVNDPETYMLLFTRRNRKRPEYLDECGGRLPANTRYDHEKKTNIIIHGFAESPCSAAYLLEMKDQFLYRDDYNVIIIDHSWGTAIDYYLSVLNGKLIGKQVAFLIWNIMRQKNVAAEQFHIVGHSLGGQIAGIAGYYLYVLTGQRIRRITGLDPAGPGYQNTALENRLDKSDAKMVDAIHTNGGPCVPLNFGYYRPVGHADFYPNGGRIQLSCLPVTAEAFLKGDTSYGALSLILPLCFHKQSVQYFKASINACTCEFIGVECPSYTDFHLERCTSCGSDGSKCAVMGMDWELYDPKNGSHLYYLDTELFCPYCDNTKIKVEGFPPTPPGYTPKCFVP